MVSRPLALRRQSSSRRVYDADRQDDEVGRVVVVVVGEGEQLCLSPRPVSPLSAINRHVTCVAKRALALNVIRDRRLTHEEWQKLPRPSRANFLAFNPHLFTFCTMASSSNIPAGASSAVLKPSEPMPDFAVTVEGPNFDEGMTLEKLLDSYKRIGFQANSLGKAIDVVNQMVRFGLVMS